MTTTYNGIRQLAASSRQRYFRLKRVTDVALSVALLPFACIVGLVCGIAILIDSWGPIFFVQERTGRDGVRFRMFKFRTMVPNAEELKASLRHRSEVPAPDFKITDDPRVTRIGRILRKTGLDELPQLINVLRGDMSLVGPRPTSFDSSTYEPWHLQRLQTPPGITGLWQVEARNEVSFDERVEYDLRYIASMSFAGDAKILLRTIGAVLRGEGC